MRVWWRYVLTFVMAYVGSATATAETTAVALTASGVGTLHVEARLGEGTKTSFLLDTGSAYVVITEATRKALARADALTPVRQLKAVMANNSTARAQVYRVSSLQLADGCVVRDFEAVALPGARKDILGLSVLRAVAPFTIDVDPLRLQLTCTPETGLLAWSGTALR